MTRKEYYLNDLHEEVPKEEATVKVIEVYKNEKIIGRFWASLKEEELKHHGKEKCQRCS